MKIFKRFRKMPFPGRSSKGYSMIELMITSVVLMAVVVGVWGAFVTSLNYIALAREESVATDDMKDIIEKLKNVAFSDLATVFPDGQTIDPDLIGGYSLNSEVIKIRYPQGTNVDPMEIEAEITWIRKNGKSRTHTYRILRTSYI